MNHRSLLLAAAMSVVAWGYAGNVQASGQSGTSSHVSVLVSESVLLQQSSATTASLTIPGPGELFVTLTDLQFPTSFSSLSYAVSNAAGPLLQSPKAGTNTLDLTAPMTLYANVFATVGQGSAGLYNLTATFVSSVPLPGGLGLFISSGALLAMLGRHRRSHACDSAGAIAVSA